MTIDLDQELQNQLNQIENGATLEQSATNLPEEAAELRPLIQMAQTVRETDHPQPSPASSQATLQQMKVAERQRRYEAGRPSRRTFNNWALASGLAAVTLVMVCMIAAAIGAGGWLIGPPSAGTATLANVNGSVLIAPDADSDWVAASNGTRLHEGWLIRTGEYGSATLTFFEGTLAKIGPQAELSLATLDGDWGKVLRVQIDQTAGSTKYQVVPLRGDKSQFVVNTPAGNASVHGTTFRVAVDDGGQASFAVDSGIVAVSNADAQVRVSAGQATIASPTEAPLDPVYQFSLNDELTAINGDVWEMAGVSFQVISTTIILGDPQVGDYILARGRILEDGWVADLIQPSPEDEELLYTYSGDVENIDGETWIVSGVSFLVNDVTDVAGDIDLGTPVRVTYLVLDGNRWLALKIENLTFEEPPLPPSEDNCTGADPQPKAQTLADEYGVTYEEIMGWFCQGFGFGEIDLAYGLSLKSGMPVEEIFDLRMSGLGWGEIKRRLATPTPDVTLTPTITPTLTITPTATLTVTITPSPTLTVTVTPEPPNTDCTGADPQPKAQTLAQQYGVTYEEIMGWFCQGFGFGEIDLVYSLSLESGVPVAEIFAMKSAGMGWGNIKKELAGDARNPKNNNPGKDKDKNKDKGPDIENAPDDDSLNPGQDKKQNKDKDKENNKNKTKKKDQP